MGLPVVILSFPSAWLLKSDSVHGPVNLVFQDVAGPYCCGSILLKKLVAYGQYKYFKNNTVNAFQEA